MTLTAFASDAYLEAAQNLNIEQVPCITALNWSEAQKKAYVIADNKLSENAGWDENMLKRKSRSMELDPKYCDVIVKRWEEFTGKKAKLENA